MAPSFLAARCSRFSARSSLATAWCGVLCGVPGTYRRSLEESLSSHPSCGLCEWHRVFYEKRAFWVSLPLKRARFESSLKIVHTKVSQHGLVGSNKILRRSRPWRACSAGRSRGARARARARARDARAWRAPMLYGVLQDTGTRIYIYLK